MKCEVCTEMLDEYLDGELSAAESSQLAEHLMTCEACSTESASLIAEQEMFSRYDRELEIPTTMWSAIAAQTVVEAGPAQDSFRERLASLFRVPSLGWSFAAAAAVVIIAIVVGAVYLKSQKVEPKKVLAVSGKNDSPTPERIRDEEPPDAPKESDAPERVVKQLSNPRRDRSPKARRTVIDQSDVLSTDYGYQDLDDRDTAKHFEQTQNLLRSIRNVSLNENDQEIDVTYDKALSRRLLNENIVLRRDAEMKAKFPTSSLLSDLEPFLIDIANLPDYATPNEVRVIKERVQKTEIVAALIGY